MTYEEMEREISEIPKFGAKASLSNLNAYLEQWNHPERTLRVIHVAGTNGKGSVCAFLEAMLRVSGYRTALFTSPHLERLNERFRINFLMCEDEKLIDAWKMVKKQMEDGADKGLKPLTYFEILFLMAVLIFIREDIDYCIMETGLGGRFDATSLTQPILSVITSISLDHTALLGNTIEKIAWEKAGIIKSGVPVVALDEKNGAFPVIYREAKEKKSHIYKVSSENITIFKKNKNKIDFSINSSYYKCNRLRILSHADYQIYNGALAATAIRVLFPDMEEEKIRQGLLNMHWEGRMEELYPHVYVDGAHNPGAVFRVCQMMTASEGIWSLLFAVCADKDYAQMIRQLSGIPWKKIYVTRIRGMRGVSAKIVAELFREYTDAPVEEFSSVEETFDAAMNNKGEEDCLLCLGSLYLAGELKERQKKAKDIEQSELEDLSGGQDGCLESEDIL